MSGFPEAVAKPVPDAAKMEQDNRLVLRKFLICIGNAGVGSLFANCGQIAIELTLVDRQQMARLELPPSDN